MTKVRGMRLCFVRIRRIIRLITLLVIVACSGSNRDKELVVTNIANAGFMVQSGGSKILIDAPFGGFKSDWCYVASDSVRELMTNAKPPFDDVQIIAYTHNHPDHFNPRFAVEHLLHNSKAIVVCTGQADKMLAKEEHYSEIKSRVRAVSIPSDSAVEFTHSGIWMKAIRTPHLPSGVTDSVTGEQIDGNRDLEHLEFIFALGDYNIYHSGDASLDNRLRYEKYGFDKHPIDLAFVPRWNSYERLTFGQTLVRDIIKPDRIILIHIEKDSRLTNNPEWQSRIARQVIFPERPMQTWTFTKLPDVSTD